jgi:hypothetical protein
MSDDSNMGARIWCGVCHAMPFPPEGSGFRQDFDLLKIRGDWRCREHRDAAIEPKAKPASKLDALEVQLDELGRFVASMELDEDDRATALELIDRMGASIGRSRKP